MRKLKSLAIVAGLVTVSTAFAQEKPDDGLNPLSLRPVHESNVAYKVTLWRRLDLKEKQNQPLFSNDSEITKYIIEGVKSGVLDAYSDESLQERLTLDVFNERLFKKFEGGGLSQEEMDAGFGQANEDDGWGGSGGNTKSASTEDDGWGGGTSETSQNGNSTEAKTTTANSSENGYELFPKDFYIIELKEDWIFDRQRSRQYYDIQSVTIKIPSELSGDGLEKDLATFKYKELETFFRNNPNAIWFNEANTARHMNLADALELRLFHGRIVRKSNAQNKYLDQIYKDPRQALNKSQELEYELLEFEHNLWEF